MRHFDLETAPAAGDPLVGAVAEEAADGAVLVVGGEEAHPRRAGGERHRVISRRLAESVDEGGARRQVADLAGGQECLAEEQADDERHRAGEQAEEQRGARYRRLAHRRFLIDPLSSTEGERGERRE